MRGTDPQGKPIRWVPRQVDPPADERPTDLSRLSILPAAATDLPSALLLLNAIRQVLLDAGMGQVEVF